MDTLLFPMMGNRGWQARREAPRASISKPTATLALKQPAINLARNNLAKKHWFHSLPFQRFQALLTLSKVLFIFTSLYLFAIGLEPIFSFRWNLPPLALQARGTWLLESTPYTEDCKWRTGLSPSLVLFSKRLTSAHPLVAHLEITIQGQRPRFQCWAYPCSIAITEGILFSFLSTAYLYA